MAIRDYLLEEAERQSKNWRDYAFRMPYLKFDPDWEVAITPPFGNADARFRVKKGNAVVSIYCDFDSNLGCMDEPYWEIHPIDGDCARYMLHDTEDLMQGIRSSIKQQNGDV